MLILLNTILLSEVVLIVTTLPSYLGLETSSGRGKD